MGNGERVENKGQVKLKMKSPGEGGFLMSSVFHVAEITRPLMSVSRICDQDMVCIFEKTHARIVDKEGREVARFARDGGATGAQMRRTKAPNLRRHLRLRSLHLARLQ